MDNFKVAKKLVFNLILTISDDSLSICSENRVYVILGKYAKAEYLIFSEILILPLENFSDWKL